MTLAQAKTAILRLMDEYSVRGIISDDPDLAPRLTAALDAGQKQLAAIKRIVKCYDLPLVPGVSEYPMPADFMAPCRVLADRCPTGAGRWRGSVLILPEDESRDIQVEYFALPPDITDATPDSTELALPADAQTALLYWTAAQLLMTDPAADCAPLLSVYQSLVKNLDRLAPGCVTVRKLV